MEFEFKLPDLGEGIAEAEIRNWLVREGEQVTEHQPVVEVETDKALVELPTPWAGRVRHCHFPAGSVVPVGATLLTIEAAEVAGERPPSYGIVGTLPEAQAETAGASPPQAGQALPAVRRLAKQLGVDLAGLRGSGPDGSVTAAEVEAAAARQGSSAPAAGTPQQRLPLKGVRRTIARNLLQAQQLTAFVTNMDEFDVTRLWDLKRREEGELAERDLHLTFLPFFMKAVQHALIEHPRFNARVDEAAEEIVLQPECHMGIAVDTADGLLVPVLRQIAKKSIIELAKELQTLSRSAQQRSIPLDDLRGSTFTLTNFGSAGGHYATPIINYPNVAILGCGRIREKAWVVAGQMAVRRILPLSLTFDHRVVDGAEASQFLGRIGRYLEDPGLLFIESV